MTRPPKPSPQRDDSVPFTARWRRGERRYLLTLGFALKGQPKSLLPPGVNWDLWYDKPYLLLQAGVLSNLTEFGFWKTRAAPTGFIETLVPVVSGDGNRGWYRFTREEGVPHRVQFFPEGKSSRAEIEFGSFAARIAGGAMPLAATPEAGFCYLRSFTLFAKRGGVFLQAEEHQNRMAWDVSDPVVMPPTSWRPPELELETGQPEFAYFAKGSAFASSLPRRVL